MKESTCIVMATALAYLTSCNSPVLAEANKPPAAVCDSVAASPEDAEKPKGVEGVSFDKLDVAEATKACESALRLDPDNARLQYQLARSYMASKRDLDKAFALNKKAADAGYAVAMINLAAALDKGLGTAKDEEMSVAWLRKAASAPSFNRFAIFALGLHYARGSGVTRDWAQASRLYCRSAQAGLVGGMVECGRAHRLGRGVPKSYVKAAGYYRSAAEAGDKTGQYSYGRMLAKGLGVDQDHKQALSWLQKAADQGSPGAVRTIGDFYSAGTGVDRNPARANQLYRDAANLGDTPAMYELAINLLEARGAAKNNAEAMVQLKKASDAGNRRAAHKLALIYDQGTVISYDAAKSASYFLEALRRKNRDTRTLLIQRQGVSVKPQTLDALQQMLIRKGRAFTPASGKLGPEAIDALMSEIPG